MQALRLDDKGRSSVALRQRLPALYLHTGRSLPVSGSPQLRDNPSLLKLREHTRDLAHGDLEWIIGHSEIVTCCRHDAHPTFNKSENSRLLNDKLPGKSRSILDHDDANTITLDEVQQVHEARASLDGIGTAHCWIAEVRDDLDASTASVCSDRIKLPGLRVLLRADVRG